MVSIKHLQKEQEVHWPCDQCKIPRYVILLSSQILIHEKKVNCCRRGMMLEERMRYEELRMICQEVRMKCKRTRDEM